MRTKIEKFTNIRNFICQVYRVIEQSLLATHKQNFHWVISNSYMHGYVCLKYVKLNHALL